MSKASLLTAPRPSERSQKAARPILGPNTRELPKAIASPTSPEPVDADALAAWDARARAKPTQTKLKMSKHDDGIAVTIEVAKSVDPKAVPEAELAFANILASNSPEFVNTICNQLSLAAGSGQSEPMADVEQASNSVLALVHGIGPRDEVETMLALQMAAIHNSTLKATWKLSHTSTIPQQDSASNMLNKLARTFAAQVEALKKYRSSGEQSIKVQHVTVADGGQAVIGNITGGGVPQKTGGQPHEPSQTGQSRAALLGYEQANPVPMPSASRDGLDSLPVPRGTGRRTEGAG